MVNSTLMPMALGLAISAQLTSPLERASLPLKLRSVEEMV